MFLPRGRARPVVFLLLASPVIAELLWGALVAAARRVAPARSQPQGLLPRRHDLPCSPPAPR